MLLHDLYIVFYSDENKQVLCEDEWCKPIMGALHNMTTHEQVQYEAIAALTCLSDTCKYYARFYQYSTSSTLCNLEVDLLILTSPSNPTYNNNYQINWLIYQQCWLNIAVFNLSQFYFVFFHEI